MLLELLYFFFIQAMTLCRADEFIPDANILCKPVSFSQLVDRDVLDKMKRFNHLYENSKIEGEYEKEDKSWQKNLEGNILYQKTC